MKKNWVIVSILLAVLIIAPSFALTVKHKYLHQQTNTSDQVTVEVTTVKQMDIPKQVAALGSLVAPQSVTISSEVDGRVAKIYFKDGQKIAQGMPIIQLDDAQAQANYDSAVAALSLSKKKYQRAKLIWAQGAVSKQDLEQLQADVESKEAGVKTALATLKQKELTAPFAGVLGAFQVNQGDFISKGDAIVTLVNTSELKVEYSLPEGLKPQLKLGQQVAVTSTAYPQQKFYGTVTFISPTVDVNTGSVAVQAMVPNKKELLSPGMFVNVLQTITTVKKALVVPDQAVTADVAGYTVYKIVNAKAKLVNVKLGERVSGNTQILQGLKLNDTVVTAGQQKLEDGNKVKIISDTN